MQSLFFWNLMTHLVPMSPLQSNQTGFCILIFWEWRSFIYDIAKIVENSENVEKSLHLQPSHLPWTRFPFSTMSVHSWPLKNPPPKIDISEFSPKHQQFSPKLQQRSIYLYNSFFFSLKHTKFTIITSVTIF